MMGSILQKQPTKRSCLQKGIWRPRKPTNACHPKPQAAHSWASHTDKYEACHTHECATRIHAQGQRMTDDDTALLQDACTWVLRHHQHDVVLSGLTEVLYLSHTHTTPVHSHKVRAAGYWHMEFAALLAVHMCIHTYVHAYIHTCIHSYIHAYIHVYIHTYIHTYIRTYIHTYIHANIHTNRRACGKWFKWSSEFIGRQNLCLQR